MYSYERNFHMNVLPAETTETLKGWLNWLAGGLEEALKFYLESLERIRISLEERKEDFHLSPTMLSRDFAEAIDGCVSLARIGSTKNAVPLLRQAYELRLLLCFITLDDNSYNQKSLSYEYHYLVRRNKYDPTNGVHSGMMNDKRYADVHKEVSERIAKDRRSKKDAWYSLKFGGKRVMKLRNIAEALLEVDDYTTFYETCSYFAHGASALARLVELGPNRMGVQYLRDPAGMPWLCRNALGITVSLSVKLLSYYRLEVDNDKVESLLEIETEMTKLDPILHWRSA